MVFQLGKQLIFPDTSLADEDGLLAVGGDLSVERLVLAYSLGIFPWYAKGEPILWYCPHQRFVINCNEIHVSRSMEKVIRSNRYEISWNRAFKEVITNCATVRRKGQRGTWIHAEMIEAYLRLHQNNIAQSVEVWQNDELVGGIYGVVVGKVFCGESMFSKEANASKLALIEICHSSKYELIDCQFHTGHLESMGAKFISSEEFVARLKATT